MMKKLKPLMFVGTTSDVGKSILTTGMCRIFMQDGHTPAPFKAQNLCLNSYATPEGLEIGRAQAVQAEACRISCHTDMNPVLLKPGSDKDIQVILNGKPVSSPSAREFLMNNNKQELFKAAAAAFERLSGRYQPIVLEGAGSIAELNIKHKDIANLRMAALAGAVTYLVADIERGGVFGSVYGTIALLTPEEKQLIKGIIINKFHGDATLFEEGKIQLQTLTGIPVTGIVPYLHDLYIDEEDAMALTNKNTRYKHEKINVAVVLLQRISNFTDFNVLERDPRVHLFYSENPDEIAKADIIILPGSKNTIADLSLLRYNGIAGAVLQAFKNNKTVIGICGGFQMMGTMISDPLHLDGDIIQLPGLGLLPVSTVMQEQKITAQKIFTYKNDPAYVCHGYEIHRGCSYAENDRPLNYFPDGGTDGYYLNDRCWGTYLHGILDNPSVIDDLLKTRTPLKIENQTDYATFKETQYDRLATHLRQHLDIASIYRNMYS
jgi:adenosylcobyric acid synthase